MTLQRIISVLHRKTDILPRDYAGGLIDRKLEPDRRLSSEAERNWSEMVSGQLNFDRRREEANVLQKIREGDLLRFFDRRVRLRDVEIVCFERAFT